MSYLSRINLKKMVDVSLGAVLVAGMLLAVAVALVPLRVGAGGEYNSIIPRDTH